MHEHLAPSDWILLAVLVVAVPTYSYFSRRRLERLGVKDRRPVYARTIGTLWALALVTLYAWHAHDRAFVALGFALPPGPVTAAAAAVCAMAAGAIALQIRSFVRASPEKAAAIRERLGATALVMPRTKGELVWFYALSVTAGICEEVLYRGYFIALAAPFVTAPAAVLVSALAFGLGHIYQGVRGVLLTAAVGLFFGAFYAITGSILWPMILHALIDINSGTVGYLLLRERRALSLAK